MFKKLVGFVAATAVAVSGALVSNVVPTAAQRVAGAPQAVTFTFQSGTLQIGSETFDANAGDDPITASGTVQPNGIINPMTVSFPPLPPITGLPVVGTVTPIIHIIGTPNGSVNPITGVTTLNVTIEIRVPQLSSDCNVGPITLNASSANAGGVGYNTTTGAVTMTEHTFSVPGAESCEYALFSVNDTINGELGIPSGSGNNHASLTATASPILQAAVRPAFTATPDNGFAPLNVTFDASSTFTSRPNPTYAWDLDNDGAYDDDTGISVAESYGPGVHTIGLRVTDDQGDSATTTRQITVLTPSPDVAITKDDGGSSFVTGTEGTYTIGVSNVGTAPTTGTITVTDVLPAGLSFVSGVGTDWTCTEPVTGTVECTHPGPLTNGDSLDDIVVTVLADGSVTGPISNTATVVTAGDLNAANDSATDPGQIIQAGIDLAIDKTHDLDDGLFRGERATYTLSVSNIGTAPATGRVRISDTLPVGTTYFSASGPGWICSHSTGVVSCFNDTDVAPGDTLNPVNIRVDVAGDAPDLLENTGSVTVDGDANTANNSDTDSGTVQGVATDYAVDLDHLGSALVVGEPGFLQVGVDNVGTATGGNPVTATVALPAGLNYHSATGDGWGCAAVPGGVECTHAGGVEAGDGLPKITVRVDVDSAGIPTVSPSATVASTGDANPANDSVTLPITVRLPQPDLEITKGHVGNFTDGQNGLYTIGVRNVAAERADGVTTVTDVLPAPLVFVSASGTGWTCGAVGQTVTCDYAGTIAGSEIAPKIAITVSVPLHAIGVVTNTATVANAGDTNPANNTANDPTRIDRHPPAPTALKAEAIVLRLDLVGLLQLRLTVLNGPEAQLTSNGVPVAGKVVTFRTLSGAVICSGTTAANGVAKCTPSIPVLLTTLLSLRYQASFAGDLDHAAATDEGALIHLNGVRLF